MIESIIGPVVKSVIGKGSGLPPTGPWDPSFITTQGWWDPSDLSTITHSGGAVSQMDDKSGKGQHMVQSVGAARPTTGIRTINGLNAMDFDGSQFLEDENFVAHDQGGNIQIFMIYEIDSMTNATDSVISMDALRDWQLQQVSSTNFTPRFNASPTLTSDFTFSGGPYNGPTLLGLHFDRSVGFLISGSINGVQKGSISYNNTLSSPTELRLFSNRGALRSPAGGCGEVIVVNNDLSNDKILTYLSEKWGIALP